MHPTLALVWVTIGAIWIAVISSWLAIASMRWAQEHPYHPDFGNTMFLIFFTLLGFIVAFGLMYYAIGDFTGACTFTDPAIMGKSFDRNGCRNVAFGDGLYFSVVTITSLGYGDLQPHGLTRLVASIESILGFLLLGLTISFLYAILTSNRISKQP